ncbi:MAG: hypothetical protein K8I29_16770 [Alphaproteobacteria bacterium]|uniref:Uncharacterized protein n=1 Tax=Candidatus Nitrobium versatile TaxID=2884831 RepID=A0A953M2Q9_9BACT|nr:hypothetical protein [Candidatus Nitrobium versatile]
MELKEFISQSIISIIEGVTVAQKEALNHGAHVNPTGLMRTIRNIGENAIWNNNDNNIAQTVRFDVAVTVEEETATAGKIGVVSGLFNLGSSGKSEEKHVAISRIQFNVPVLLPGSRV